MNSLFVGILTFCESYITVADNTGNRYVVCSGVVHERGDGVPGTVTQKNDGDIVCFGSILYLLFQAFDSLVSHGLVIFLMRCSEDITG